MARFTARVELHDAVISDYEKLHHAMAAQGFTHTIVDDTTGLTYLLPPAEYNFIGPFTRDQVIERAELAAASTYKSYSILVTPSEGRIWVGLQQASQVRGLSTGTW